MLEIRNLTKRFGGLAAVNDVSTTIEPGKINAIIGPNGAGKTTFFNLISGVHRADLRQHHLQGRRTSRGLRPDQIARLGIVAHLPDHGAVRHGDRARQPDRRPPAAHDSRGCWTCCSAPSRLRSEERDVPREGARRARFRGPLARGASAWPATSRRRSASAWLSRWRWPPSPSLVLLDEPAGGVNPEETEGLAELIRKMVAERPDGVPDRAQDGHGHEPGRQDPGAELRREDRRGNAGARSAPIRR